LTGPGTAFRSRSRTRRRLAEARPGPFD
jgi:hypothetical protein